MSNVPNVAYGFIGLGVMGWGMAKNLRAKIPESAELIVCEVVEKRRDQFIAETEGRIRAVENAREVAEQADIVITMLPKGPHVLDVFTNPDSGLLSSQKTSTEKLFIDCSTIDVKTSLEVGKAVEISGRGKFVDAPVSGGPNGAFAVVGGVYSLYERVKIIVSMMGKNIFHCGPAGAGLATKQINNYISAASILAVCEGMNMGERYGLDPKVLAGVINVSSGKCYNSLDQNPVKGVTPTAAAANGFNGGFSTELCKGVIDMAVDLAKHVGAKSVLSGIVQDTFEKATRSDKCSGKDCRSVYRLFSEDDGRALD